MKVLGVIPARYESTRMPGKPLKDILGKPMIYWVYKQAEKCQQIDELVVATDDERIVDACKKYNMKVLRTLNNHDTPTSRLYEVSTKISADLYLMVMGDEPLVNEKCFDLIIPKEMFSDMYVAALTNTIDIPSEVIDFSNQKVVVNRKGNAMLISRSPIPYPKGSLNIIYNKVTGVQIFAKRALDFYNVTGKSDLEKAEENDLMRFIENEIPVKMIESPYKTVSVDTPKDLDVVRRELERLYGSK